MGYNRDMNTICLVVDRLHGGYLGAYGNCWIETPAFDRLASQGFVFDQCLINSPHLESLYRSYWLGQHALIPSGMTGGRPLAATLADAEVQTVLLTDDPLVAESPLAASFAEVRWLSPSEATQTAATVEETHLAECFSRLIEQVESLREPFLVWCHLTGLASPWDAPLDFRLRYVEPGDPEPPSSVEVPSRFLEPRFDPDQVLGICHAYAGQVSLLDTCLAAFLECLDAVRSGQETLLWVASARGFPLAEHRRVGPCGDALYGELVQVPLFARFPDPSLTAGRSQALVEPPDLWATILDWHGFPQPRGLVGGKSLLPLARDEVESVRDRLYVTAPGQRAIRTPAWYLRERVPSGSPQAETDMPPGPGAAELFVKPDDRWEVNEVSDRAAPVVELLHEVIGNYEQAAKGDAGVELCALDDVLSSGLE